MSPEYNPYVVGAPTSAKTAAAKNHSCDCAPVCPDCGGLSCVCRPRFFAGQLLTEVELNGVMDYVRDRNRQRNRLFGAGVVCGLEVSCDPCGAGSVTVSPGHAISPCGEDIVVCSPASVSVCDLINICRERDQHERNCPPYGPSNSQCAQREETWILYIRYAEQSCRPMTALPMAATSLGGCGCGGQSKTTSGGCACGGSGASKGCACGGSSSKGCACGGGAGSSSASGGCGCGGSHSAKSSARVPDRCAPVASCSSPRQRKPYQPACEPTVVCEAFSFSMTKVEPNHREGRDAAVAAAAGKVGINTSAFAKCRADLDSALPKKPTLAYNADRAGWNAWCCAVHDALPQILSRHALHDCSLLERLRAVPCPAPNDQNFVVLIGTAEAAFKAIVTDLLRSCLCSLLQPPCPTPVDDDRVALATIVIRRDPCSVKSICNWDVRDVVLTPRAVTHWLGLTTVPAMLRALVESLCCGERAVVPGRPAVGLPFAAALARAMSADDAGGAAMPRLVEALFSAKQLLTKPQREDPTEYVLAADVLAPIIRGTGASWSEGVSEDNR